jgi:hypothetical protein
MEKSAAEQLQDLWEKMKAEGNCEEYVKEMCKQLTLLGTETNSLTKQMVGDAIQETIDKINYHDAKYFH